MSVLILISLGLWWGSKLLSNKNIEAKVERQVSEAERSPEVSEQQIWISSKQIEQVGIKLHTLGASSTDIQKQIILQGQVQWSPESKVVLTSPVSGMVQQVLVQPLAEVTRNHHVLAVHSPDLIQVGNISINKASKQVLLNQVETELTHKEFHLLELFTLNRGRVISRENIENSFYAYDWIATDFVDTF